MTDEGSTAAPVLEPVSWETRNLRRASFQLTEAFSGKPDEASLRRALAAAAAHGEIFVQARVDCRESRVVALLEGCGFHFVETTLGPRSVLERNKVLARFEEDPGEFLPRKFSCADLSLEVSQRGDAATLEEIRGMARHTFDSDRFHLDHLCPAGAASKRFAHWVDDLAADPQVVFYSLLLRGKRTGFFAVKEDYLVLAGLSASHRQSGLGDFFWLSVLQHLKS
ncbi:hypothetical protein ACFL2P_03040, partial [Candidatus Moduliflexota bacterium]